MSNLHANLNIAAEQTLCLACGLCCNGVIFADVQLQSGDEAVRVQSLGLKLKSGGRCQPRLMQPCEAYDGSRCRIYAERPQYCSEFECLLLKSVKAGNMEPATALRIIGRAREQADKVCGLLRELGDSEETLSLGSRFRRTARRMESLEVDKTTADLHAQLTLAVHDLNRLLAESFYPGGTEGDAG
jgi:Fe-S-cluster containining protein